MSDEKYIYGKNVNTGTNYGHIGDKFEGIKPRELSLQDFNNLEREIQQFKASNSHLINNNSYITIGVPGDNESHFFANQIYNALTQNGYAVQMAAFQRYGYTIGNYEVSNAPDGTVMICIFAASNI